MSNPSEKRPTDLNVKATSFGEEVRTKAKNAGKSPEEQDNAAQIATQAYLTAYDKDLQPRKHLTEDEKEAYAKAYASARVDGKSGDECRKAGNQAAKKRREDRKKEQEFLENNKDSIQKSVDAFNSSISVNSLKSLTCINTVDAQTLKMSPMPAESQLSLKPVYCSLCYSITKEDLFTYKKQLETIEKFFKLLNGDLVVELISECNPITGPVYSKFSKKPSALEKIAKLALNLVIPSVHEQATNVSSISLSSDPKLIKQAFVDCSNLKVRDSNEKLQFHERAKKKLDEGIQKIYDAISSEAFPCEVIIDIGGHCELQDFVYAACYLFSNDELEFTRLISGKKTSKSRKVIPSKKTFSKIREYVEKNWKAKFDNLKDCGWKYRLNCVSLFECTMIHAIPRTDPKGLDALLEFIKQGWNDWTSSDTADIAEFVPTVGGFVQNYRFWTQENKTFEGGVNAIISLNPFSTIPSAIIKRSKDPNYNASELVHFWLTAVSFAPHPVLYIGAPIVDCLVHLYELHECFEKKDRKGCVEHAKAIYMGIICLVPTLKTLQIRKMSRFLKNLQKKRKELAQLETTIQNKKTKFGEVDGGGGQKQTQAHENQDTAKGKNERKEDLAEKEKEYNKKVDEASKKRDEASKKRDEAKNTREGKDVNEKTEEKNELQSELDAMEKEDVLNEQRQNANTKKTELQNRLNNRDNERIKLEESRDKADKGKSELDKRKRELDEKKRELDEKIVPSEKTHWEKEMKDFDDGIAYFKSIGVDPKVYEDLKRIYNSQDVGKQINEIKRLENELGEIDKQIGEIDKQIGEFNNQLKDLDGLETQIGELDKKIGTIDGELGKRNDLKKRIEELDDDIQGFENQAKELENEAKKLEDEAKKLEDEAEILDLEARKIAMQEDINADIGRAKNDFKYLDSEWEFKPNARNIESMKLETRTYTYKELLENNYSLGAMEVANQLKYFRFDTDIGFKINKKNLLSVYFKKDLNLKSYVPHLSYQGYQQLLSYEGALQSAWGAMISQKKNSSKSSDSSDYTMKDIEFTWDDVLVNNENEFTLGDVWGEAAIGTAIDIMYMPSDIMAFILSEDSPKPFASVAEAVDYAKENYGLIPVSSLFEDDEKQK